MPTSINSISSFEDSEIDTEASSQDNQQPRDPHHRNNDSVQESFDHDFESETSSLADQYEDYEHQVGRNSGGGSKKPKNPKHGKKTTDAIKRSNTDSAEKNRREFTMQLLKRDLEHFPIGSTETETNTSISNYLGWVSKKLQSKEPLDIKEEIQSGRLQLETKRRSSGPGGQNVNKTAVTAVCKHLTSGLTVESTKTRELPKNQQHALNLIQSRLQKHIENWRTVLSASDQSIAEIAYQLLEERL